VVEISGKDDCKGKISKKEKRTITPGIVVRRPSMIARNWSSTS
jgi:hypothetical protein